MKQILIRNWHIVIAVAIIFLFFSNLFFPPSIFITPDYGRSDLIHSYIPGKLLLQQSARSLHLPLWDTRIGQGFPLFDEGQMGFMFLPNTILFTIMPFWLAFNLGYVIVFLLAFFGMYLLARSIKIGKFPSLISGLTFAFCPIFTLHLHHYNLIETAAITPWLFWLVNSFTNTKKIVYLLAIPLFLSQQIFAGFPQFVVYTLLFLFAFFLMRVLPRYKNVLSKTKLILLFFTLVTTGALIASVQLEATYRLAKLSPRISGIKTQKILSEFPYKPKNLLTVFDPYILGDPRNATYPRWEPGKWGIFWENNSYFGVLQLILISGFLISLLFRNRHKKITDIAPWLVIGTTGLILSLGNAGPLHPVFSIPPVSLFRVPARFLLFGFLSAAVLAGISTQMLPKPKNKILASIIPVFIIAFVTFDLFRAWSSYNLIADKKDLLENPPTFAKLIGKDERVISFFENTDWNKIFTQEGWGNKQQDFLFFRNFLGENSNLLYDKSQASGYESLVTRRAGVVNNLARLEVRKEENKLELGTLSQKILNLSGVIYLTSPVEVNSKDWDFVAKEQNGPYNIYLYKNLKYNPKVFTVSDYQIATTVEEFARSVSENSFDEKKTIVLEKDPLLQKGETTGTNEAQIVNYQNNKVVIEADFENKALLVLSDSFDPAWKANIDGIQTEIMPANVNSRAVVVDRGKHRIEFAYQRNDIILFGLISIISTVISSGAILKFRKFEFN